MQNRILQELEEGLSNLRAQERRDPIRGEITRTFKDAARFLGFSRMSLYRYRQMFDGFPPLPAFKIAIQNWKERWNLPRERGPQPSQRRKEVVYLREEGLTFEEIGKKVGVSREEAWQLWDRHLKSQKGRDSSAR